MARGQGLPDSEAWRRKFTKLREQELLREPAQLPTIQIEEEIPETPEAPRVFQLKPLVVTTARRTRSTKDEPASDPYILSQTAWAKMERANRVHQCTLQILKSHLEEHKRSVSESKLIDAYAVLNSGPAIFEVKSITESNEREQIRHALSQLYEYRFLHSMADASLWIVFSQAPSSRWYIDYLAGDRGIRLLWVSDGRLQGLSLELLN